MFLIDSPASPVGLGLWQDWNQEHHILLDVDERDSATLRSWNTNEWGEWMDEIQIKILSSFGITKPPWKSYQPRFPGSFLMEYPFFYMFLLKMAIENSGWIPQVWTNPTSPAQLVHRVPPESGHGPETISFKNVPPGRYLRPGEKKKLPGADAKKNSVGESPWIWVVPSGKHTKNYGKSPFLMGKLAINGHFH